MNDVEFYHKAQEFLYQLSHDLESAGLKLEPHWDIDHICYRSDSEDHYKTLKNSFEAFGRLLIESEVNGRLISTFKLFTPILFQEWRIDLVELPAPKSGKMTVPGFEHIEIVCDEPFEVLMERYKKFPLVTKGLQKDYNQELEIEFGERNLKFHHSSLASVINMELNQKVWNAISDSQILKHFKSLHPLIAGTFPLSVNLSTSDVDVLLHSDNLASMEKNLKELYSNQPDFEITKSEVDGLPTLICQFCWDQVPFEVFAQNRHPVEQKAYRHFLVEERLLKLGGDDFFQKILSARADGLKTELAFGKVLDLQNDPYEELLTLQQLPNRLLPVV